MVKKIFPKNGHVKKVLPKLAFLKKCFTYPPKYSNQDISLLKKVFYLPTPHKIHSSFVQYIQGLL